MLNELVAKTLSGSFVWNKTIEGNWLCPMPGVTGFYDVAKGTVKEVTTEGKLEYEEPIPEDLKKCFENMKCEVWFWNRETNQWEFSWSGSASESEGVCEQLYVKGYSTTKAYRATT